MSKEGNIHGDQSDKKRRDMKEHRIILKDLKEYLEKGGRESLFASDSIFDGTISICLELGWITMYAREGTVQRKPIALIADPDYREKTLSAMDSYYKRMK